MNIISNINRQYYVELKRELGAQFDHTLFIHKRGVVTFLIPKSEFESFGRRMVEEIQHDPAKALARLDTLKTNTDKLSGMIRKLGNTIPTITEYQEFKKCFSYHLPLHNFMKKTVDFLPDDLLQELLPRFKEARVYSEHIYRDRKSVV